DLISVENNIISLGTYFSKFSRIQERQILFHRHRERMMHGKIASLFIAPLKLRKFGNPNKAEFIFIQEIKLFRKLHTERSQRIPHNFVFISGKQKQVSRLSVHSSHQSAHLIFAHKLDRKSVV